MKFGLNKFVFRNIFIVTLFVITSNSNVVSAGSLTYSPDQWPRHWNVLINKSQQQSDHYRANGYNREKPARSPMWGMMPTVKQKSRRTLRPEYNTNTDRVNHSSHNIYYRNYYSGFSGYGLANPYVSPLLVPGLMPGLSAPGIPFITNPYAMNPYMGGMPAPAYRW